MRRALTLLCCAAALGCATARKIDWIPAGPVFPPKAAGGVEILYSRDEIRRPWGAIGVVHGYDMLAGDKQEKERQIRLAAEKAAAGGADAVVLAERVRDEAGSSGGLSQVVYITGIAIKYIDKLSEEEKLAVEKWNLDNSRQK